ncbi:PIN2/TERF1-interacting telomerase inhibitor 1 [Fukomys damarensis]|uniref:PIN2/TERF1-interacting telomerase inhibitor 1 n=1 Tax=Fukomys damarensis TaxID=885580 RepID=A0A091E5Q6_FUKDA|nr:PIN2/TERF1-interacting telomerase inhibitor 1 [Fukomys damarensis]
MSMLAERKCRMRRPEPSAKEKPPGRRFETGGLGRGVGLGSPCRVQGCPSPFPESRRSASPRKQKWAVDPRNTAWSNDDSKFGQRMLEKMGWSKGKGLGAQEQGATDHIKVQVKNNHLGLGATNNNEDNWIAHQDDFNQLLAELNTCHGQETTDSPDNKEKKFFSLEEKSKVSKNRVHYMKFTKGCSPGHFGDCQSQASMAGKELESDGGRTRDINGPSPGSKDFKQDWSLPPFLEDQERRKWDQDECSPATEDRSETSTTTTSTLTIQEYFAYRMAQLRSKPQDPVPEPDLPETHVGWKRGKKKAREAADQDVENYPQTKPKKKKREGEESQGHVTKKGDRAMWQPTDPCRDEATEDCAQAPGDQECAQKPRRKRAKTKLQQPVEVAAIAAPDEAPGKKKKKKKKKKASK